MSIICRHKIENQIYRKNAKKRHWFLDKMASPAQGVPLEGIPNISKSRCHQNLSNTVNRIEIGFVEKKINSITDWSEGPRAFFFAFSVFRCHKT